VRTLGRVLQQVTKVILQPRIGKERNDLNDRECERRMNGVIVGKVRKVGSDYRQRQMGVK